MPYDATIDRLPIFALFDLKGAQADMSDWGGDVLPEFPETPNTARSDGGTTLLFIGQNRWLVRADIAHEAALETALRPAAAPPDISIVRVSDTLTFFRITGPDAAQLMSIGCPLDLHPEFFCPDAVSYTEFFGLKALVLGCANGFEVGVEQSFANLMADYLARAMA